MRLIELNVDGKEVNASVGDGEPCVVASGIFGFAVSPMEVHPSSQQPQQVSDNAATSHGVSLRIVADASGINGAESSATAGALVVMRHGVPWVDTDAGCAADTRTPAIADPVEATHLAFSTGSMRSLNPVSLMTPEAAAPLTVDGKEVNASGGDGEPWVVASDIFGFAVSPMEVHPSSQQPQQVSDYAATSHGVSASQRVSKVLFIVLDSLASGLLRTGLPSDPQVFSYQRQGKSMGGQNQTFFDIPGGEEDPTVARKEGVVEALLHQLDKALVDGAGWDEGRLWSTPGPAWGKVAKSLRARVYGREGVYEDTHIFILPITRAEAMRLRMRAGWEGAVPGTGSLRPLSEVVEVMRRFGCLGYARALLQAYGIFAHQQVQPSVRAPRFKLTVKTLAGDVLGQPYLTVKVSSSWTVAAVKEKILAAPGLSGLHRSNIRLLILRNQLRHVDKHCSWAQLSAPVLPLDESFTLDSYGIRKAVTVRLVLRVRGCGDRNDDEPGSEEDGEDGVEETAAVVDQRQTLHRFVQHLQSVGTGKLTETQFRMITKECSNLSGTEIRTALGELLQGAGGALGTKAERLKEIYDRRRDCFESMGFHQGGGAELRKWEVTAKAASEWHRQHFRAKVTSEALQFLREMRLSREADGTTLTFPTAANPEGGVAKSECVVVQFWNLDVADIQVFISWLQHWHLSPGLTSGTFNKSVDKFYPNTAIHAEGGADGSARVILKKDKFCEEFLRSIYVKMGPIAPHQSAAQAPMVHIVKEGESILGHTYALELRSRDDQQRWKTIMEWLSVVCTQAEIAVSMTCMLGQMGVAGVAEIVPEQPQRSLLTVYDTDDSHQRPSRLLLKMSCFGGANENQRTLAWKVGPITFDFSQYLLGINPPEVIFPEMLRGELRVTLMLREVDDTTADEANALATVKVRCNVPRLDVLLTAMLKTDPRGTTVLTPGNVSELLTSEIRRALANHLPNANAHLLKAIQVEMTASQHMNILGSSSLLLIHINRVDGMDYETAQIMALQIGLAIAIDVDPLSEFHCLFYCPLTIHYLDFTGVRMDTSCTLDKITFKINDIGGTAGTRDRIWVHMGGPSGKVTFQDLQGLTADPLPKHVAALWRGSADGLSRYSILKISQMAMKQRKLMAKNAESFDRRTAYIGRQDRDGLSLKVPSAIARLTKAQLHQSQWGLHPRPWNTGLDILIQGLNYLELQMDEVLQVKVPDQDLNTLPTEKDKEAPRCLQCWEVMSSGVHAPDARLRHCTDCVRSLVRLRVYWRQEEAFEKIRQAVKTRLQVDMDEEGVRMTTSMPAAQATAAQAQSEIQSTRILETWKGREAILLEALLLSHPIFGRQAGGQRRGPQPLSVREVILEAIQRRMRFQFVLEALQRQHPDLAPWIKIITSDLALDFNYDVHLICDYTVKWSADAIALTRRRSLERNPGVPEGRDRADSHAPPPRSGDPRPSGGSRDASSRNSTGQRRSREDLGTASRVHPPGAPDQSRGSGVGSDGVMHDQDSRSPAPKVLARTPTDSANTPKQPGASSEAPGPTK